MDELMVTIPLDEYKKLVGASAVYEHRLNEAYATIKANEEEMLKVRSMKCEILTLRRLVESQAEKLHGKN